SHCNNADGTLATGPKGAPKKPHRVVAALGKGASIARALRLAVQLFRGSESTNKSETLHWLRLAGVPTGSRTPGWTASPHHAVRACRAGATHTPRRHWA